MNIREKGIVNKEVQHFHEELESWLVKWFIPQAKEIRENLNEKFDSFEENLKSKLSKRSGS